MKYKKIGSGRVLKCWESKIKRFYEGKVQDNKLICGDCSNVIGEIIEENYVKMDQKAFTYTGTKD